ncbi:Ig-like domain-containing protein, partial [Roseovarius sp. D22-M7]
VNDDPVASDDTASTNEDAGVAIDVLANDTDVDGDTLTVASLGAAANGSLVDNGDGTVSYTPDADFNGSDSFTYTVEDGNGGSDTATVSVTVGPVNDAPVAADDAYATAYQTALTIAAAGVLANDTDVEGDTLSAVLDSGPANGSLTLNADGSFGYTPDAGFSGSDSFTYFANDGSADAAAPA